MNTESKARELLKRIHEINIKTKELFNESRPIVGVEGTGKEVSSND